MVLLDLWLLRCAEFDAPNLNSKFSMTS